MKASKSPVVAELEYIERCWELAAPGLDAQNSVRKPPEVVIRQASFDPMAMSITAAATSVALYEFALT
jgi:hypothetical protein